MISTRSFRRGSLLILVALALGSATLAQNAGPPESGMRQWRVTSEMRNRAPLMPWQRTLEDALAMSRITGKPLLVCVNSDGEAASESLAWGRYRDPEFVGLASGFIPVLASPQRREARERDDRGRRLADRRFGRLVNREHIDIEPVLFERWFEDTRVAPRHVGVSLDGEVLFDVYLLQDLAVVDDLLREHGVAGEAIADPRTLDEAALLGSPDASHREELEARFFAADERSRVRLAGLALSAVRDVQHPELLYLGLRDESAAVRRQTIWTLLQHLDRAPLDVLPRAFAEAAEDSERERSLLAALRRLVDEETDETRRANAAFHLRVFSALSRPSTHLDPARWRLALAANPGRADRAPTREEFDAIASLMEQLDAALAATPDDVDLLVDAAVVRYRFGRIQILLHQNPLFFFEDAVVACDRALALDSEEGRAWGMLACARYLLNDPEGAGDAAARALPRLRRDAGSPIAGEVLNVFAQVRTRELYAAIGAGEAWDKALLPDVLATYEALLAHPAGGEGHWKSYLDLLGTIGAHRLQGEVVRRGLARFPFSGDLHAMLRAQVLRDAGARALEAAYEEEPLRLAREANPAYLDWFHGLATLIAAEQDVQNRDPEGALGAYRRSRDLFERAIETEAGLADSARHYQCLALAGAARLQGEAGNYDAAVKAVVESMRLAPGSRESVDGLGNSPRDTADSLRRTLERSGEQELAQELETRLGEAEASAGAPE